MNSERNPLRLQVILPVIVALIAAGVVYWQVTEENTKEITFSFGLVDNVDVSGLDECNDVHDLYYPAVTFIRADAINADIQSVVGGYVYPSGGGEFTNDQPPLNILQVNINERLDGTNTSIGTIVSSGSDLPFQDISFGVTIRIKCLNEESLLDQDYKIEEGSHGTGLVSVRLDSSDTRECSELDDSDQAIVVGPFGLSDILETQDLEGAHRAILSNVGCNEQLMCREPGLTEIAGDADCALAVFVIRAVVQDL